MTGTTPARSSPKRNGASHTLTADKRSRHDSSKVAQAKKDKEAHSLAKKAREEAKKKRKDVRAQRAKNAVVVDRADDSEEVRCLKEKVNQMQAERDAAQEELSKVDAGSAEANEDIPAIGSLARPPNLSKITIHELRELLHLDGDDHDDEWNEIRASVRHNIDRGNFDLNVGFKGQDPRKITRTYAAIEEDCPILRSCRNGWGVEHLVKEAFTARNTYRSCVKNPNTYRYRKRRERRACRARSCSSHPQSSAASGSGLAHEPGSGEGEGSGDSPSTAGSDLSEFSD